MATLDSRDDEAIWGMTVDDASMNCGPGRSGRWSSSLLAAAALLPLMIGAAHADSATAEKPGAPLIPAWLSSIWDPATSPFIPIPEVGTDPNSGTTFGILPIFLSSEHDQITRIIAPDVNYNPDLGYGGNFRIFGYPSTDEQWSVVAGAKQRVERGVDGVYTTGILRQQDWSFFNHLVYDRSASGRFFGIGNESRNADQTNYTNEQAYLETILGRNFGPTFQIALDLRPRYVQIERGTSDSLPSTNVAFPQVVGLGNEHEFLSRLFVSYDTRDSSTIPTSGSQIVGFAGVTDKAFLSTVSYSRFGLDARHFQPLNDRLTLAAHVALQYMPIGDDVPFWALSSLGGDRSVLGERQPLRGFGSDRFVDRNSFSSTVELRTKIFDINLFTTDLTFEMAPFVDAGRVFHNLDDNPLDRLHVSGGIGLRAVAKPFIVGYVDIGYGSEGVAIFSGINYPF
jgi:Omp85 superfamily domain